MIFYVKNIHSIKALNFVARGPNLNTFLKSCFPSLIICLGLIAAYYTAILNIVSINILFGVPSNLHFYQSNSIFSYFHNYMPSWSQICTPSAYVVQIF